MIDKFPKSMKPLLYLAVNESKTWHAYIKKGAKQLILGPHMLCSTNQAFVNTIKKLNNEIQNCRWPVNNFSHGTHDCFKIKISTRTKRQKWQSKNKKLGKQKKSPDNYWWNSKDEENEGNLIYSMFFISSAILLTFVVV